MAAGGGTFTVQNKVLPGTYINFVSKARPVGSMGDRGILAIAATLNWGEDGKIITIENEEFQKNCRSILGYNYIDSEMKFLRESFCGAKTVKLYKLNSNGEKATATITDLKITAKCSGTRGNDIKIVISASVDDEDKFIVKTLLANEEVDEQTVAVISELKNNDFVSFEKLENDTITATAGTSLTGGTNSETTGNAYSTFLDKIECEDFTTIAYSGTDSTTKGLFSAFTKRLRDEEGYKVTCVLHDYTTADHESVISVKNSADLVYWVAGKTAGAEVNESLTNMLYDGELTVSTAYKSSELKEAVADGEFVFYGEKDEVRVLKDINTFTSILAAKNSDFTNNQVIRVLDAVGNDTARIFNKFYLGKVQNNEMGRDLFKNELISYCNTLQAISAIENFESDDIEIEKGTEKGDVTVSIYVEPVGAMEKLYMTCVVI